MQEKRLAIFDQMSLKYFESTINQHTTEELPVTRWTQFSWSSSRHAVFTRCKREYYLNYYGARNVRGANNAAVSAIWWLKRITNLKAWIGTIIHETAAAVFREMKSGHPVNEDFFRRFAGEAYFLGINASKEGKKFNNPFVTGDQGEYILLDGHVYEIPDFDMEIDRGAQKIEELLAVFFSSEAYRRICDLPLNAIREIDPPFQSFVMQDIPRLETCVIFAIPDLLIHDGEMVTIYDWKTGDPEKEQIRLQAGVYRLYAQQKYRIDEEQIDVRISALGVDGLDYSPKGGLPTIEETKNEILSSIASMVDRMASVEHNTAAISQFPMTDDLSLCHDCAFRRACWREEKSSGQMSLF